MLTAGATPRTTNQEAQLRAAQMQAEESSSRARALQAQLETMEVQKADLSTLLAQERMARAEVEQTTDAGAASGPPLLPPALALPVLELSQGPAVAPPRSCMTRLPHASVMFALQPRPAAAVVVA